MCCVFLLLALSARVFFGSSESRQQLPVEYIASPQHGNRGVHVAPQPASPVRTQLQDRVQPAVVILAGWIYALFHTFPYLCAGILVQMQQNT